MELQKQHSLPIPGIKVRWVDDPTRVANFFFCSQIAPAVPSHVPHHLGIEMLWVFSHLAQLQSVILPPAGPDPPACFHKELVVYPSPPCTGLDNSYQGMAECWYNEAMTAQLSIFPTSPFLNFLCKTQGARFLSGLMDFAAASTFSRHLLQILSTETILDNGRSPLFSTDLDQFVPVSSSSTRSSSYMGIFP